MAANNKNKKKGQAPKKSVPKEPAVEEPVTEPIVVADTVETREKAARDKAKGKKQGKFMGFLKKADPIALTCFVVIVVAFAFVLGDYIKSEYIDESSGSAAIDGSTVQVEYVGSFFTYYTEDGAVIFDTNMESVANDESMVFSGFWKTKDTYDNLSFTIGGGQVLKKFSDACIGMKKGDTVRVEIPVTDVTDSSSIDQSYGKVETKEGVRETTIPKSGTVTLAEYNLLCGTSYSSGSNVKDTDTFIENVSMHFDYVSDKEINYTVVSFTDGDTKFTTGASVNIVNAGTDMKITYNTTKNAVDVGLYDVDETSDVDVKVVYLKHTAGSDKVSYWNYDSENNAAMKGEGNTMYFVIKIKSVA